MSALPVPTGELALGGFSADKFDGWQVEDFLGAHGENLLSFRRARAIAGILLYGARRALPDGAYGEHLAAVASLYEVSPRTISTWRRDAEVAAGLPPADERSAKGRERATSRVPRGHLRPVDDEPLTPEVLPGGVPDQLSLWAQEATAKTAGELAADLGVAGLVALRARLDEALELLRPRADPGCQHPKDALVVRGWGTICETAKGGCGARVR